uniref:Uncharacterized protein n=1 Tax=Musca domestica TaxID=7370 RepID=A0A1I8NJJ4_MUSDO
MFITNNHFQTLIILGSISHLYASGNLRAIESNQTQIVELKQLMVEQDLLGCYFFTFKCSVGQRKTARIDCASRDHSTWPKPHDVELNLKCPNGGGGGEGSTIAFAEVVFTVTNQNVNCFVAAGGVGQNFIQMHLNVEGTRSLDYTAEFFVN